MFLMRDCFPPCSWWGHHTPQVHMDIIMALSNYLTLSISDWMIYTLLSTAFMPSDTAGTSCQNPWKMIYIFCPSLEGISLSSKYGESGTSSSDGIFALSHIETLVLPEAESQTRQSISTSLAQVPQATATEHMFIGPLPYIFYCFLRIRFQKEQNLFQTRNKPFHAVSKRKYCSGFFLKQLSLSKDGVIPAVSNHKHVVHGYRADLKYFLLFTTYAQKPQPKPPQGQTPPCFLCPFCFWVQGFSHIPSVLLTKRNGIAWRRKHLCGKAQVAKLYQVTSPGQMKPSLWALNTPQASEPTLLVQSSRPVLSWGGTAQENCAPGDVSCLYLALPVRCIDKNNVFWQLVIGNQDVI